jgi:hypothetical protein
MKWTLTQYSVQYFEYSVDSIAQYSVRLPNNKQDSSTFTAVDRWISSIQIYFQWPSIALFYTLIMTPRTLVLLIAIVGVIMSSSPSNNGPLNSKNVVVIWLTYPQVSHEIFMCVLWSSVPLFGLAAVLRFLNTGIKQRPHKQHQCHSTCFLVLTKEPKKHYAIILRRLWRKILRSINSRQL